MYLVNREEFVHHDLSYVKWFWKIHNAQHSCLAGVREGGLVSGIVSVHCQN